MPLPFSPARFNELLCSHTIGSSLRWFDELDSTNRYAQNIHAKEIQEGLIVGTDFQRAGRGQHQRTWESTACENLLFSVILTPYSTQRLRVLLGLTALSVCSLLEQYEISASIKWPNDVYVEGKKICGVLIETVFNGSRCERVVIGVGLNVNQTTFSSSLTATSTSFHHLLGKSVERETVLAEFCLQFERFWLQWTRNLPGLIQTINKKIKGVGDELFIFIDGKRMPEPVRFLGIDDTGIAHILTQTLEHRTFQHEQLRFKTP